MPLRETFIRPRDLAEMLHIDPDQLVRQIEEGVYVAVWVEGDWAIPRKQAMQIMGLETRSTIFLYRPDEIVH